MTIKLARPMIGQEERDAVDRVLASGVIAQGPEVAAFEAEFGALVEGRECVAVSSGTSALHLGLLAAGIGQGDEVILPSFSFAATANSVALTGAVPAFADIDSRTFCLDPEAVRAAITPRTAAIMPVHLYGHPADMGVFRALAERYDLLLLEDAAQAHGARLDNRQVGSFGAVAAFSFYPTKNMTTGEGGMIVLSDPAVARQARLLRNQGMEVRYRNELVGFNARMTDIAAAIGRVQLGRLPAWNERRRDIAAFLDEKLKSVKTPTVAPGAEHVYHQYTIRSADRDCLQARLRDSGVDSEVYYPVPIHRLPSFDLRLDLPETERAVAEVLSLPIHPRLTDADVQAIAEAVDA